MDLQLFPFDLQSLFNFVHCVVRAGEEGRPDGERIGRKSYRLARPDLRAQPTSEQKEKQNHRSQGKTVEHERQHSHSFDELEEQMDAEVGGDEG